MACCRFKKWRSAALFALPFFLLLVFSFLRQFRAWLLLAGLYPLSECFFISYLVDFTDFLLASFSPQIRFNCLSLEFGAVRSIPFRQKCVLSVRFVISCPLADRSLRHTSSPGCLALANPVFQVTTDKLYLFLFTYFSFPARSNAPSMETVLLFHWLS